MSNTEALDFIRIVWRHGKYYFCSFLAIQPVFVVIYARFIVSMPGSIEFYTGSHTALIWLRAHHRI